MPPLTRARKARTCYIIALPNELLLEITKLLPIKARLAFADTCTACRPLVSDIECIEACKKAGLTIVNGVSPRSMAKLLCRPRIGVCNWSLDGGEPKSANLMYFSQAWLILPTEGLNFTSVLSTSPAIVAATEVKMHPCFMPLKYYYMCEIRSWNDFTLRIGPGEPEINFSNHRLYQHEYLTSPPLRDLRVQITEDEGPLADINDIGFMVGKVFPI